MPIFLLLNFWVFLWNRIINLGKKRDLWWLNLILIGGLWDAWFIWPLCVPTWPIMYRFFLSLCISLTKLIGMLPSTSFTILKALQAKDFFFVLTLIYNFVHTTTMIGPVVQSHSASWPIFYFPRTLSNFLKIQETAYRVLIFSWGRILIYDCYLLRIKMVILSPTWSSSSSTPPQHLCFVIIMMHCTSILILFFMNGLKTLKLIVPSSLMNCRLTASLLLTFLPPLSQLTSLPRLWASFNFTLF